MINRPALSEEFPSPAPLQSPQTPYDLESETPVLTAGSFLEADPPEVVPRWQPGMIQQRGINFFQIHKHAQKRFRPKHIITADGPNPREIDDGVFVDPLPSATEMYRIGVCLPDTSKLYQRPEVLKEAMAKLHADYWIDEDGDFGYRSLIDEHHIRRHEMSQGNERQALILRFVVGQNHPPSDTRISFERVYVERNLDYDQFSKQVRPSQQFEYFARAGHYLMKLMPYIDGEDAAAITQSDSLGMVEHLMKQQPDQLYIAGSRLTAAYMVAVNHLGGLLLQEAGRAGIYRVHNPRATEIKDFVPASMARFSLTAGPHIGLGLSNVLQISSPLRRLQDGLNGLQHAKLAWGVRQDNGDRRTLEEATQLLNYEIISKHVAKKLRKKYPGVQPTAVRELAGEMLESMVVGS